MGKQSRKHPVRQEGDIMEEKRPKKPLLVDPKSIDPSLAQLFTSSLGPVIAPSKARYQALAPNESARVGQETSGEEELCENITGKVSSSTVGDIEHADISKVVDLKERSNGEEEDVRQTSFARLLEGNTTRPARKRKKSQEEDLEREYMSKLAMEEDNEEEKLQAERRLKRQRIGEDSIHKATDEDAQTNILSSSNNMGEEVNEPGTSHDFPMHETVTLARDASELEKATRTVFLANVSTSAITSRTAKKLLLTHLTSFLSILDVSLPGKPSHKLESLRFRSTAYAGTGIPKKAAFAKQALMLATTRSTNAYAVYSSAFAAREAVKKLNGSMILDRHLRVDGVAHPAKTDHRRCVFVGNLGFVDDESLGDQGGENNRKRSKNPSDIEEGLWRQFGKAGKVESVRVVRDEKTRVGKGFAYVQFEESNAVEAALLFNEKKFPPMLPRFLRVVRAKAIRKKIPTSRIAHTSSKATPVSNQSYKPKLDPAKSSLQGRASKLLGRAGGAQHRKNAGSGANSMVMGKRVEGRATTQAMKTPETIVFEGFRASAKAGKPNVLKFVKSVARKKGGRLATRSARRGREWKKGGKGK